MGSQQLRQVLLGWGIAAVTAGTVVAVGVLVAAAGQFPEEKEDPKGGVKRKVVVDDDVLPVKPRPAAGHPPDVQLDELERAAAEPNVPAPYKTLYQKYRVPFDLLVLSNGQLRIKPVPIHRSQWKNAERIGVEPLDGAGKPQKVQPVAVRDVRELRYFEQMVLADATSLITPLPQGSITLSDYAAAEKLLAAALRYHDYARERNLRRGAGWEELREPLYQQLRQVRLAALRHAQKQNDLVQVRQWSQHLSEAYPQDEEVTRTLAAVRLAEAERYLQSASHLDHVRGRELLDDFEARFPAAEQETTRRLRARLREMAQQALQRAREKKEVGDLSTARDELARAAALDPALEGLRELQRELRFGYPVLYVGIWHMPRYFSPALAKLDSEIQAVELLFEGLLTEVADSDGRIDYRPAAARDLPRAVPGGREFSLRIYERDPTGRPGFDSHDVVGTVQMLQQHPSWTAYPLTWLSRQPPLAGDPATVRCDFAAVHPEPRAVFTFKLLPARWMRQNNLAPDDLSFGLRPYGTGPYRLQGIVQTSPEQPREVIFIDNPAYGLGRDRMNLPRIREIRFVEVKVEAEASKMDAVAAFREGRLHILPDIPTHELARFRGPGSGIQDRVDIVTARLNRRVHILAVNLERPYLQRKALRQGLSLAIDREEVLDRVFRPQEPEFRKNPPHAAMNGPFPPRSWAATKTGTLTDRDLAVRRFEEYLADAGAKTELTLSYPAEDRRAQQACVLIKTQIERLFTDRPRKITIVLEAVPMRDLLVRVQDEHRYDLAYVPFDYPDDWYPYALAAMLDPAAAVRGGRNWFSFLGRNPDTNPDADDLRFGQLLTDLRFYRDFSGSLLPRTAEIVRQFNQSLPFIPLWQLDRHIAIHRSVKIHYDSYDPPRDPAWLNPTTLLTRVAWWQLE